MGIEATFSRREWARLKKISSPALYRQAQSRAINRASSRVKTEINKMQRQRYKGAAAEIRANKRRLPYIRKHRRNGAVEGATLVWTSRRRGMPLRDVHIKPRQTRSGIKFQVRKGKTVTLKDSWMGRGRRYGEKTVSGKDTWTRDYATRKPIRLVTVPGVATSVAWGIKTVDVRNLIDREMMNQMGKAIDNALKRAGFL